jgi:hypothetical protein
MDYSSVQPRFGTMYVVKWNAYPDNQVLQARDAIERWEGIHVDPEWIIRHRVDKAADVDNYAASVFVIQDRKHTPGQEEALYQAALNQPLATIEAGPLLKQACVVVANGLKDLQQRFSRP